LNGFGEAKSIESERAQIEKEFGVQAIFDPADLAKPASIAKMIETATGEFGKVDILVNNAGIQHTAPVEDFPLERWDAVIAINLSANFHAIRAVIPQMRSRNWGRIINIASTHGLVASVEKAAYVAAKHGVLGLTKVVALETATTNITCNAICPGWVLTPLVEKQIKERASRENISVDQAKRELLAENSRPTNLPFPRKSVRSRYSCVRTLPPRYAVLLCPSMVPGPRNKSAPFILIFINVGLLPLFRMCWARLNSA
jgi:3-hydroxybutyrate dehydrogenase